MRKDNILFVDDEANVLQGLRRMLRGMRDEWEMTFVGSGDDALRHMAAHPVDVIVSDMRMPNMDGAQLLQAVSHRFPETIRIVLSGYAEQETVMQSVGPSHQYLAKPCDPDRLTAAIKKSVRLREYLRNPKLRELVTGLKTLPSMPAAYREFIDAVSNPAASTASIVAPIERDIGLTAEILKLTNSAYFCLPVHVTHLEQALQLLGIETIRGLVTLSTVFAEFQGDARHAEFVSRLSRRSFTIGGLARDIARLEGLSKREIDQAFCAGMLSHVGSLILMTNLPTEFDAAGQMADREGTPIADIERRQFMASHPEIGAYLLGLWGFSHPIVESVLYHHGPGGADRDIFGPTSAVHVAQALARFSDSDRAQPTDADIVPFLDMEHLTRLDRAGRLADWRHHVVELRKRRAAS